MKTQKNIISYNIYKIILKNEEEGVKEENIKDLQLLTFFYNLQQVADYLNYNNCYLSKFNKDKQKNYILINNDYIIYKDVDEVEGV